MKKFILLKLLICITLYVTAQITVPGNPALRIYTGKGNPNGTILNPNAGELFMDNTGGSLWVNEGGTNAWVLIATGSGGNLWTQSGSNLFPTTLTNSVGIGTATPVTFFQVSYPANVPDSDVVAGILLGNLIPIGVPDSLGSIIIRGNYVVADANIKWSVTSPNVSVNANGGLVHIVADTINIDPNVVTLLTGDIIIPNGASAGYVLTSDAVGNASWQPLGAIDTTEFLTARDTLAAQRTVVTPTLLDSVINGTASWLTNGNAGTNPATNFIGTTDGEDLVFKVDGILSGRISTVANGNTSFGEASLINIIPVSNSNCTAVGVEALSNNTIGTNNTGFGFSALDNNYVGSYNTAVGSVASGDSSSGLGGNYNSAFGYDALEGGNTAPQRSVGNYNTAIGSGVLNLSDSTNYNTGVGANALTVDTGGSDNTGIGVNALSQLTNGGENTALGFLAGDSNTIGADNTYVGAFAGKANTTGIDNTFLGFQSNATGTALTNATAIGANAKVGASNLVAIGDSIAGTFCTINGTSRHSALTVDGGDVYVAPANGLSGVILVDTGGNCWRIKVTVTTGVLTTTAITCP